LRRTLKRLIAQRLIYSEIELSQAEWLYRHTIGFSNARKN
jgi:phage-related minor tail protein